MNLRSLNTHAIANTGVAVGALTLVLSPLAAFFKLVSQPSYLFVLGFSFVHIRHGNPSADDWMAVCQLAGAFFAVVGGGIAFALTLAYYGRPRSVP